MLSLKWTQLLLQVVSHRGLGPGGDGSLSHCHEGYSLLSMLELTSETSTGHRQNVLQSMPQKIAESAKAGPFIKHLLVVKHPVSCCWSYKHRCLTTPPPPTPVVLTGCQNQLLSTVKFLNTTMIPLACPLPVVTTPPGLHHSHVTSSVPPLHMVTTPTTTHGRQHPHSVQVIHSRPAQVGKHRETVGTPPLHLHLPLATSTPEEARLRVSAGDKQRVHTFTQDPRHTNSSNGITHCLESC